MYNGTNAGRETCRRPPLDLRSAPVCRRRRLLAKKHRLATTHLQRWLILGLFEARRGAHVAAWEVEDFALPVRRNEFLGGLGTSREGEHQDKEQGGQGLGGNNSSERERAHSGIGTSDISYSGEPRSACIPIMLCTRTVDRYLCCKHTSEGAFFLNFNLTSDGGDCRCSGCSRCGSQGST